MNSKLSLTLGAVCLVFFCSFASSKYVDLTYALNKDVVLWPGREITYNIEAEMDLPDGGWVASRGFCISEHTSTHIDAPYHFNKKGWTLDQIPFDSFMDRPGVCIDIYDKVHRIENGKLTIMENYVLTREDILEWEGKHGRIPDKALVLVRTGWASRWPNNDDYKGIHKELRTSTTTTTSTTEANRQESAPQNETLALFDGVENFNFPGFGSTAAVFLSNERNVVGVGMDTLGIDAGNAKGFPAHKIFTQRQVYMLENMADLHLLPPNGFTLFAVPFKVDAGTGAPTRVIAKLRD